MFKKMKCKSNKALGKVFQLTVSAEISRARESFSRDCEGKGLPASCGQSTQQGHNGELSWVVTSAALQLG